ncbi:hypothetical protein POL68_17530 [Stigmatella sp. ncwal1]|uniref:Uncharacterized protein n=1 Tax=Stigmatella ashevillensis TaxID=2995309 RepID=A0ABT5DD55_9BACT|nr:hypothetical protein [Stigmatella ashevillena]
MLLANLAHDTAAGALRLDTFGQSIYLLGGLGSKVYLAQDARLYSLSLSGGGRSLVTTLPRDNENQVLDIQRAAVSGDVIYFPVFATGTGAVLFLGSPDGVSARPWFTRGTAATTGQLTDVYVPVVFRLEPEPFVRAGSRVFFPAVDDTGLEQLWSVPASVTCPPGGTEPL